jgi:bacterioferritin
MKGKEEIIGRLNARLSEELAAVNQYMLHAEMCDNWGYARLHAEIEKRARDEMKHAEKLIGRILFLDGKPVVSNLSAVNIGADVESQLKKDLASEVTAVKAYNEDIAFAAEVKDNGTKELLDSILIDEEQHVDTLEAHLDQISQMGIQNFLADQIG